MNKKSISIIIVLVIAVIISVFILDFRSKRPDKRGANPYEFNVVEYRHVDPDLISYKESKNFPVSGFKATGIDVANKQIWLVGESRLQAIGLNGVLLVNENIDEGASSVKVHNNFVYIAFEDHVKKYSLKGEMLQTWDIPGRNCVLTSLDADENYLYVADAGNRRVLCYDFEGSLRAEFAGKSNSAAGHGFIVPSANFDLLVNPQGELWVVNPGKHALEKYNSDGELLSSWQNSSMEIDGFTGCCNPAEVAALPDGSFVTSEKGLVRVKIYNPDGVFQSVVAAPDKFEEEGHAPEIAVDEDGVIYALDFDRKRIRVFEKND